MYRTRNTHVVRAAVLLMAVAASSNAYARFAGFDGHSSAMSASTGALADTTDHKSSTSSGPGRIGAFLFRHRIMELQGLIATQAIELQKLSRFPHAEDLAKIAALKAEIARETRQLHFFQGV
jgi:hypothetical protein